MTAYQNVEYQDSQNSGQRLREENSERSKAENLDADDLKPETQRGLVKRHKTTWIVGDKKEIMEAIGHTTDTRGIVKIPKTVLPKIIEIHENGNQQDATQGQSLPDGRFCRLDRHLQRLNCQVFSCCDYSHCQSSFILEAIRGLPLLVGISAKNKQLSY